MGSEISRGSRVVAAGEQTSCRLTDEVVILGLKDGVYYGLNPVAARVWELVRQPRTVSEILAILLDEYDVEAERCEGDLLVLLRELASRGLVTIGDEAAV